jgi:hypothetical protein
MMSVRQRFDTWRGSLKPVEQDILFKAPRCSCRAAAPLTSAGTAGLSGLRGPSAPLLFELRQSAGSSARLCAPVADDLSRTIAQDGSNELAQRAWNFLNDS